MLKAIKICHSQFQEILIFESFLADLFHCNLSTWLRNLILFNSTRCFIVIGIIENTFYTSIHHLHIQMLLFSFYFHFLYSHRTSEYCKYYAKQFVFLFSFPPDDNDNKIKSTFIYLCNSWIKMPNLNRLIT